MLVRGKQSPPESQQDEGNDWGIWEVHYQLLNINRAPSERAQSFKYSVHITRVLPWTTHIKIIVKKVHHCLYHLRQLQKFRLHPEILKTLCLQLPDVFSQRNVPKSAITLKSTAQYCVSPPCATIRALIH